MEVPFAFRLLLVVAATAFAVAAFVVRGRAPDYARSLVNFTLASYIVSFFAGASLLFLFQDDLLTNALFFLYKPSQKAYVIFWLLGIIPLAVAIFLKFVYDERGATAIEDIPSGGGSFPALGLTLIAVLFLTSLYLAPLAAVLVGNAVQLVTVRGSDFLYTARAAAFSQLHVVTAGLVYGTLPSLAVILGFYDGKVATAARVASVIIWIIVLVGNLGTFQTAPLLAAALAAVFVRVQRSGVLRLSRQDIVLAVGLFFGFMAYNALKPGMSLAPTHIRAAQVLLRMPSASPYLVDLRLTGFGVPEGLTLSKALGRYMFATGVGGIESYVPQPAFMAAWYDWGVLGAVLAQAAIVTCAVGVARFGAIAVGVVGRTAYYGFLFAAFHLLYYGFQTTISELVVSSYSVAFPLIPPVLLLIFSLIGGRRVVGTSRLAP